MIETANHFRCIDYIIESAKEEKSLDDILEFHVKFERIHPFQDGNGRVGRLIMFKQNQTIKVIERKVLTMRDKRVAVITIIVFILIGVATYICTKPVDVEVVTHNKEITPPNAMETKVPSVTEPVATGPADTISGEELKPEETIRLTETGIYTFYNKETGSYLSFDERTLVLSEQPCNWKLNRIGEEKFHVYVNETDLVLDIDNAYVAEGTTIKLWNLTGYDVQLWHINKNSNETYTIAYSGNNDFCLGFDSGSAKLQRRNESNPMQEWEVVDVSASIPAQYLSYESEGGIIELQLPLDILEVISKERVQQWANDLETAYHSFYELTRYAPFDHIVVEAYKPSEYVGWVMNSSNIIHIDDKFIRTDLEKMAARECDWNFCALHEMGHMFDFNQPWKFEAEVMTDLKVAYVLEKNGAAAAPSEFPANECFYGADIIDAYDRLSDDFSENYNIFGLAKRLLVIKENIGWEPFEETFHYIKENETYYTDATNQKKFEEFVAKLSLYGSVDVKSYFSTEEWNVIINKTNS